MSAPAVAFSATKKARKQKDTEEDGTHLDVTIRKVRGLRPSNGPRFSGFVPRTDREAKGSRRRHEVRCNRLVRRRDAATGRRGREETLPSRVMRGETGEQVRGR